MYQINIYVPKRTYYNSRGDIIQTWDQYGIENAAKWQEDGEELYYQVHGSSRLQAELYLARLYTPEVHRREDIDYLNE